MTMAKAKFDAGLQRTGASAGQPVRACNRRAVVTSTPIALTADRASPPAPSINTRVGDEVIIAGGGSLEKTKPSKRAH